MRRTLKLIIICLGSVSILIILPMFVFSSSNLKVQSAKNPREILSEQLDGFWLSDEYFTTIEKSRSVYKNKECDTELFGFQLLEDNLMSDSAYLYGFTIHEGGYYSPLKYLENTNKFILDTEKDNFLPEINKSFEIRNIQENSLELYFPVSERVDRYRKAENDIETPFREILISGDYKETKTDQTIKFESNGTVHNFKNFAYFEVIYDFGLGIEFDALTFFKTMKGGNWDVAEIYKFELKSNQLFLQRVKTDWENFEHQFDNEVIVLEKI